MAIYEPWSVVVVPFPFIDRLQVKRRPALVLSPRKFQSDHGCAVLGMITDARNPRWLSDAALRDLSATGLRLASVFRCKLVTTQVTGSHRRDLTGWSPGFSRSGGFGVSAGEEKITG